MIGHERRLHPHLDPATGRAVARVTHFGMDGSMTLDAYGNVLSRAMIEELFAQADYALA